MWKECRHSKFGRSVGSSIDLGEFVVGATKADLESFDLAEPALPFGLADSGDEVVADFGDAGALRGVGPNMGQRMQACSWMQGVANAPW